MTNLYAIMTNLSNDAICRLAGKGRSKLNTYVTHDQNLSLSVSTWLILDKIWIWIAALLMNIEQKNFDYFLVSITNMEAPSFDCGISLCESNLLNQSVSKNLFFNFFSVA